VSFLGKNSKLTFPLTENAPKQLELLLKARQSRSSVDSGCAPAASAHTQYAPKFDNNFQATSDHTERAPQPLNRFLRVRHRR